MPKRQGLDLTLYRFKREQRGRLRKIINILCSPLSMDLFMAHTTMFLDSIAKLLYYKEMHGQAFRMLLDSLVHCSVFKKVSLIDLDWFLQCAEYGPGFTDPQLLGPMEKRTIKALDKDWLRDKRIDERLREVQQRIRHEFPGILHPRSEGSWLARLDDLLLLLRPQCPKIWNLERFLSCFTCSSILWKEWRCSAVHSAFVDVDQEKMYKHPRATFFAEPVLNPIRDGYRAVPTARLLKKACFHAVEVFCDNIHRSKCVPADVFFRYNGIDGDFDFLDEETTCL